MPSFSTSLSGLNANSAALAVIANNLANLNTVGYKSMKSNFRDLYYQQIGTSGAGNPVQIGVGAIMGSTSTNFAPGNIESTGGATDLAIQGDGFFVVSKEGLTLYTRTGNFSMSPAGYLVSEDGGHVQGYPAINGAVGSNQPIGDLMIQGGQLSPPQSTGNVQLRLNLDSSAADPEKAIGTFTMTGNAADSETITIGSTTYTFKTALSAGPTVANEVLLGATAAVTLANLTGAINHETTGGQTEGTTYSTGTVANTSVTATTVAADPVKATGIFTVTGNAANDETITIGSTIYTFKDDLTTVPATVANEIHIGAAAADTLANLKGAINHEAGGGQTEGTTYSTGTVENTFAAATAATATTLSLEALTGGTSGNSIATTESVVTGSFAAATLAGGTNATLTALSLAAVTGGTSGNSIATTESVANGSFAAATLAGGTNDTFSTSVAVYDALGASHVLTVTFTKTAANNWDYQITLPAADTGGTGSPTVITSGSLTFDGTGGLTSPSNNVGPINITGLANGAQNLTFNWELFDDNNLPVLTQVAAPSAAFSSSQDGYASGTLLNFGITPKGVLQGLFSNGQTLALGQIALATFPNNQGLLRQGENNFLASLSSGLPNAGTPGTGGRGSVSGGALEASNVDIAREFALLILAQRGYQANARAITTADEVTQEAINLKR